MSKFPDCRFCQENNLLNDQPIGNNGSFYMLAGNDPETPRAIMVIPHRHVETPFELEPEEWQNMADMLDKAKAHLAHWKPDGYTIGWNVRRAGGQSVAHAHMHVFARFDVPGELNQGIRGMLKKVAKTELAQHDLCRPK